MSYFSGNLFQPYTPNASYGYAGYDHRAVHGGLYPHIGTQQLMPYHGDAGWHPGYTGYGQDGAANGAAGGAAGAGAGGPSAGDIDAIAGLVQAIMVGTGALVTGVAQAEAANTLAEQAGLNQQQAEKYQTEIAALMTQIQAGQQSGTQQGAQDAAMTADQLALLIASAKDEQDEEDEGMSPGAVAAIAIGGVALVGAVIFFATKAGRGAHYGRHSYHY